MKRTGTMLPEQFHMHFGGVSLVSVETVLRILFMEAIHLSVSIHFGQDGVSTKSHQVNPLQGPAQG